MRTPVPPTSRPVQQPRPIHVAFELRDRPEQTAVLVADTQVLREMVRLVTEVRQTTSPVKFQDMTLQVPVRLYQTDPGFYHVERIDAESGELVYYSKQDRVLHRARPIDTTERYHVVAWARSLTLRRAEDGRSREVGVFANDMLFFELARRTEGEERERAWALYCADQPEAALGRLERSRRDRQMFAEMGEAAILPLLEAQDREIRLRALGLLSGLRARASEPQPPTRRR